MSGLPVRANLLTVTHDGAAKTTVTNERGPSIIWKARFPGEYDAIVADGGTQRITVERHPAGGAPVTAAHIIVGAGEAITAEAR